VANWLTTLGADALAAFSDLRTQENTLSVWYIHDDESNLEQVVTAIMAGRQDIDSFEYALFDEQTAVDRGLQIRSAPGDTCLDEANQWHRHLVDLSAEDLIAVAQAIVSHSTGVKRFTPSQVRNMLAAELRMGNIDINRLSSRLQSKILGQA